MREISFWVYVRNIGDGSPHPLFFETEGEAFAKREQDEEEYDLTQRRPYKETLFLDRKEKIIGQETYQDIEEEPEEMMYNVDRYKIDGNH